MPISGDAAHRRLSSSDVQRRHSHSHPKVQVSGQSMHQNPERKREQEGEPVEAVQRVASEQVKILLSLVPIFVCTIIFNTILAQLQTFSVTQGTNMNTYLTPNFNIPSASLQSIPYMMLIFVVPFYDTAFVPLARRFTRNDSRISPLQRMGTGLFIETFSMVSAAIIEHKRRVSAVEHNQKLSIFWIAPQFLIFGLSEMFIAVGLIEFFYKQSIQGMQSSLTAMTYCSYSFGFYLSSLLVSFVNRVSSRSSSGGWLSDNDLNKDRLDLIYWLLAALSLINFSTIYFGQDGVLAIHLYCNILQLMSWRKI